MKNETLNIKQFCELDLKTQKSIATGLYINLNHFREKIYDFEYQLEFNSFIDSDEKININNEIEGMKKAIENLMEKIDIVSKVMNNFIVWEN